MRDLSQVLSTPFREHVQAKLDSDSAGSFSLFLESLENFEKEQIYTVTQI